jgi:hypothetical protein
MEHLQEGQPIHIRHPDVGNNEREVRQILPQRFFGGGENLHGVAGSSECFLQELARHRIVIDDNDAHRHSTTC